MTRKARPQERIRSEFELTRNNGQQYLTFKAHHPKSDFMATTPKKKSTRPTPVKLRRNDDETYDLNPPTQTQAHQVSLIPAMEATATACFDQTFRAIDLANEGDNFGAVTSGAAAVTYGFGILTSILHIGYTSHNRSKKNG
jgi:hypothetical protein